uniref:Putative secreted protein n=1 Tax=Rhipicephalus microplus TaxID=6941 RepID=A0A6G5A4A7_RHIMP
MHHPLPLVVVAVLFTMTLSIRFSVAEDMTESDTLSLARSGPEAHNQPESLGRVHVSARMKPRKSKGRSGASDLNHDH